MGTIKLYFANRYEALRMDETGYHWSLYEPVNTLNYKYDDITEHIFELPDGVRKDDVIGVYTEFDNSPLIETMKNVYKLTKELY